MNRKVTHPVSKGEGRDGKGGGERKKEREEGRESGKESEREGERLRGREI